MDLRTQVHAVLLYLLSSLFAADQTGKGTLSSFSVRESVHGAMRHLLQSGGNKKPVEITNLQLVWCGFLIILTILMSLKLRLGLGSDILIAALRAGGQLILLGYILEPVFAEETLWSVSVILVVINTVGAREVYAQCERYYWQLYPEVWVSILIAWVGPTAFGLAFVIKVDPWYRPQYIIPVVGLLLGNVLKGVQLALDTYTLQLMHRHDIELYMSRGATPWEATVFLRARATRVGMTPTIQLMTIMGVVSIPGMMTGQIMGGTPPMLAAKYQIVLTFLIAASSLFGILINLFFVQIRVFKDQKLNLDVIQRRSQKSKDIVTESVKLVFRLVSGLVKKCRKSGPEREPLLSAKGGKEHRNGK